MGFRLRSNLSFASHASSRTTAPQPPALETGTSPCCGRRVALLAAPEPNCALDDAHERGVTDPISTTAGNSFAHSTNPVQSSFPTRDRPAAGPDRHHSLRRAYALPEPKLRTSIPQGHHPGTCPSKQSTTTMKKGSLQDTVAAVAHTASNHGYPTMNSTMNSTRV